MYVVTVLLDVVGIAFDGTGFVYVVGIALDGSGLMYGGINCLWW